MNKNYKKIFTTDLDGTVIYSHNYTFSVPKKLIEVNKDYTAYMNLNLYNHLAEYNKNVPFIPVTTRSLEQYQRIQFPIVPDYALVLNGAILLKNNIVQDFWVNDSRNLISESLHELSIAYSYLEKNNKTLSLRNIDDFFVFSKIDSDYLNIIKYELSALLDLSLVDIYSKKQKLYIIPKNLNKGIAVQRLKEHLGSQYIIASGDSEIDNSMLDVADEVIPCDILKNKGTYIGDFL